MSPRLLATILLHSFEVFVLGGVAFYCFVLNKAQFMDLWYIWAPVVGFTMTGTLIIQRIFPNRR